MRQRLNDYPELTAKRLYKEIRKQGYEGSYRTVRRYVARLKAQMPQRVYKPYETNPGEQAQVDWGHEEWVHNGVKVKVYSFVYVLSHSRMRYVEYVTSLDSVVFLNCLYRAFEYMGGVPKKILFDNAKVVVSERVGSVIRFQTDLLQFAALMRFQPDACWVEDPETKGKVESTVGYVHRDFFYGREFSDLGSMNQQAREWCDEVNREVHSTTQEIPVERWVAERAHLTPLPQKKPDLFRVQKVKVNKACLFSFGSNKYSVPKEYARQYVRLEIYELEFRVMANETEIGRWPRTLDRNKQFLIEEHYQGRFKGSKKSALEVEFRWLCDEAPAYLERLKETRGNSLRDQMKQIVQLSEQFSTEELGQAMSRSLRYSSFGYDVLHRILRKQRDMPRSLPEATERAIPLKTPQLPHVTVETRDTSYYASRIGGAVWKTSSTG
jgi:transposase